MAEKFMAAVGQGFVQTQIMSETNSNKYKLTIAAEQTASTPGLSQFLVNDEPIGIQENGAGLNVRLFNTSTRQVVEFKTFEIRENDNYSGNTAFIFYMDNLVFQSDVLAIITSGEKLLTSPSIRTWMTSHGSKNWPYPEIARNYNVSFAAIYDVKRKLFITETTRTNDNKNYGDTRAKFETVYDTYSDIGSTGYVKKVLEDGTTLSNENTNYRYHTYSGVVDGTFLKTDDILFFTCQMKNNIRMIQRGSNTKISVVWFNGNIELGYEFNTIILNVGNPNFWVTAERYFKVPLNATNFEIWVETTPGNGMNEQEPGDSSSRNFVISLVSRFEKVDVVPASIGVNGIKMNKGADNVGASIPELRLPDTESMPNAVILSKDFREKY